MVAGHRLGKRLISFLPPEFGVLGGAQHCDTPKSPNFGGEVFDLGGGLPSAPQNRAGRGSTSLSKPPWGFVGVPVSLLGGSWFGGAP